MKLPRTQLTDLAELMVRHPRVLNYGGMNFSQLRAELARLNEFIGMIVDVPVTIAVSIIALMTRKHENNGGRTMPICIALGMLAIALSLIFGWEFLMACLGMVALIIRCRYSKPSIWW